ncbi:hypothetical protein [Pontimicrobium sp. IMCC45349]|uniref:hypothetical protein n=1 Tax=Pontimicrobium sp. IMCC45349 TaxID=3391574 RepID=UPI00399F94DE
MKHLLLIAILITSLTSCTTDQDELTTYDYSEKWELFNATSNQTSETTSTNGLNYQEFYYLDNDSTFFKRRISNNITKNIYGTYNVMTVDNNKYFVFKYNEANNLIGNCSNNLNEVLRFTDENKLINIWNSCDGPTLEYRKVYNP